MVGTFTCDRPNIFGLTDVLKFLTICLSIEYLGWIMQTTISSKFQVVIPKAARKRLNLRPQQKLTVIEKDGLLILVPKVSLGSLRGIAAGANVENYRDKKDRY